MKNKKILLIGIISSVVILLTIISSIIIVKAKSKTIETSEKVLEANEEEMLEENEDDILDLTASEQEDEEELKEETEKQQNKTNTNNNKLSSNTSYYIKVNYQANVVTIYQKDGNGELNPVKAMVCSTGTATPKSGVYNTKTKWAWGKLFGNVYGHYVTKIVGNILFHSVPYTAQDPSTLEYWEYDKLGTSASMGCVRLRVIDSKWIFDNIPTGTPVEFYASGDPGPLGKPGAQKISSNVECRDWDPTDPDSRNPWRNYKPKEEQKQVETKQEDKKENNVVEKAKEENNKTNVENKIEENKVNENILNNESQENIIKNNTINEVNNTIIQNNTTNEVNNIINNTI